jgi:hypothetical protein
MVVFLALWYNLEYQVWHDHNGLSYMRLSHTSTALGHGLANVESRDSTEACIIYGLKAYLRLIISSDPSFV